MKTYRLLAPAALAAAGIAVAAPLAPDAPLIEDQGIKVTALDFEAAMTRVPEERRLEVRASQERIATLVDSTYIGRQIATKARAMGLDKDPVVQKRLQQVQEQVLTDIYLTHMEKNTKLPDLEKRAKELYQADLAKYRSGEQVYIQHILVGLTERTRPMALQRATELRAELDATKEDFLKMSGRVSDDPEKRKNGGDLGWWGPTSLEAPIVEAIAKMKKGEVSQPIETRHGYHLVKFIDRKAAEQIPFESVRSSIMRAERDRLLKLARENAANEFRESKTVIVHKANLEALRAHIDMSKAARDSGNAIK